MKFLKVAILFSFFIISSFALGRNVTAKKIKVIPRSSSIKEIELASIFLAKDLNNWRKVDQILVENQKYENKSRKFKIDSGKELPNSGDLSRSHFFITKNHGKKEPLSPNPISGLKILDEGKFLILEPLILVDTTTWEKIDLAKAANIHPYFSVIRYSSKSNKILVAQFDCAYDCPKTDKTTIWEISF
jgi:hypothetical protein